VTNPRYAQLASKALGELDPASPPAPEPGDRARTIVALTRRLAARGRRRRRLQWAAACGSVAAVAFAVVGAMQLAHRSAPIAALTAPAAVAGPQIVAHPVGGGSSVVVSGAQAHLEPLDDGRALAAGSRVVTPADGSATLSFSSGTSAFLHEGTDMTLAAEGAAQVMRLEVGAIDLHVAKLTPGERFIVDTPDSEVEVRGTRFRVSVVPSEAGCGAGAQTRVAVTEGVVVVRHAGVEDRIVAGGQWPAGCTRSAPSPVAARRAVPHSSAAQGLSAGSAGSTLADQNDLFTSAMSAKRRGDGRTALAGFDRFLLDYPNSPLAESAVVERMRLLHATAPARCRAAASDYLAQHPNGFAHTEAEVILAETR
jgi:ferric-dicitrate binding protein FerR (iron transport regulator)